MAAHAHGCHDDLRMTGNSIVRSKRAEISHQGLTAFVV